MDVNWKAFAELLVAGLFGVARRHASLGQDDLHAPILLTRRRELLVGQPGTTYLKVCYPVRRPGHNAGHGTRIRCTAVAWTSVG